MCRPQYCLGPAVDTPLSAKASLPFGLLHAQYVFAGFEKDTASALAYLTRAGAPDVPAVA